MTTASTLITLLSGRGFSLSNEKRTQAEIAQVLTDNGVEHEREKRLSAADIVDFFLPATGVAVEVKLRQSRTEILRQLVRYAAHPEVTEILLVSGTAIRLPRDIGGKPARLLSLGQGWL